MKYSFSMHTIVHRNYLAGKIFFPAIFFLSILLASCDPRGVDDMYLQGTFQIKAKIFNPQDSLNLGDSLKVVFEIPDTILLNNVTTILTEKTFCEMGEGLAIADSTRPGGFTNPIFNNTCKIYANPGTINSNNVFRLSKIGNKLLGTYYMIPTKKGIFFFSSQTPGYFDGNSTSGKVKCRIVFDFDVPNKHHNLLQPAIGVNNNLIPMINSMAANGQGLYVFAVR